MEDKYVHSLIYNRIINYGDIKCQKYGEDLVVKSVKRYKGGYIKVIYNEKLTRDDVIVIIKTKNKKTKKNNYIIGKTIKDNMENFKKDYIKLIDLIKLFSNIKILEEDSNTVISRKMLLNDRIKEENMLYYNSKYSDLK